MTGMRSARVDRRAFLSGVAACALAGVALAPVAARAQQIAEDDQAEWRQSYETSDRVSIGRESTPTLSPATVAATEQAINLYQSIVARGGWNAVPAGGGLKIGAKGKAVQALRQRLVASGDLDYGRRLGPVFDSFVDAAVKRFQIRHGLEPTGKSTKRRSPNSMCRRKRGCSNSRPTSSGCAPIRAISANVSSWSTFPPPRSRRSRTAPSIRITPPGSAKSTASRRSCRPRRPR